MASPTSLSLNLNRTKFIFVTGGVISGIGKGVTASCVGALLKCYGFNVTAIKIDPYINMDAGTFSPIEHGETFVLDDGGEVDLDLGNYERFLDVKLTRDNNITTGKIYQHVINCERRGDYLGKTVQIIPHVTNAINEWILKTAGRFADSDSDKNLCIVEVGGIVGDIESAPFFEALRQLKYTLGSCSSCFLHLSLMPTTGGNELKTKPTQTSVKTLLSLGIIPDIILCRSEFFMDEAVRSKVSLFCNVPPDSVISLPNVDSIYQIPSVLQRQNIIKLLSKLLNLRTEEGRFDSSFYNVFNSLYKLNCEKRASMSSMSGDDKRRLKVAIVGKYVKLKDSYHSIYYAIEHAALAHGVYVDIELVDSEELVREFFDEENMNYNEESGDYGTYLNMALKNEKAKRMVKEKLKDIDAIIIPGGFGTRGTIGKILTINYARVNKVPILGICYGMQLMVIEWARSMTNGQLEDANSTEIDSKTRHAVIINMEDYNKQYYGGTMRLGAFKTEIAKGSLAARVYNAEVISERHRHRYEVNIEYKEVLNRSGLVFSGVDEKKERMEIVELEERFGHPFFFGVQFHPEFLSRPNRPAPCFGALVGHAAGHKYK